MTKKIKVGIIGYGNLGRGAEKAIQLQPDMELVAIFSRRGKISNINPSTPSFHINEVLSYKNKIDVMILCSGSKSDLPEHTPHYAAMFNTVDSFDNHAKITEYYCSVNKVAKKNSHISIISVGWDPGLFSINRVISEAVLINGSTYTFWGKGLSQGHSDAIRRVEGVKEGVQYTIPSENAIARVRKGERLTLSTSEKHHRECFIVLKEGADPTKIEKTIKQMPDYFVNYDTAVHFVSQETFDSKHRAMSHGGFVIRSGTTKEDNNQIVEFSLKLDSNPEFTSSVLVAYARAAYRLHKEGEKGAKTVYDIGPGYIHPLSSESLRKKYL